MGGLGNVAAITAGRAVPVKRGDVAGDVGVLDSLCGEDGQWAALGDGFATFSAVQVTVVSVLPDHFRNIAVSVASEIGLHS